MFAVNEWTQRTMRAVFVGKEKKCTFSCVRPYETSPNNFFLVEFASVRCVVIGSIEKRLYAMATACA